MRSASNEEENQGEKVMRKTNSELSTNSQSAKSQLSLRKRIKETLAMALSLLMVFSIVGMPLEAVAQDYTEEGAGSLVIGTYYWEGDTLTFPSDTAAAKCYLVSRGIDAAMPETYMTEDLSGERLTATGDYFKNPTITFKHRDADTFPAFVKSNTLSVYKLESVTQEYNDILTFYCTYGFHIDYQNDSVTDTFCVASAPGYDIQFVSVDAAPSVTADPERGDLLGWSTVSDYDGTEGLFFKAGETISFLVLGDSNDTSVFDTSAIETVSSGVMKLYPVYSLTESEGTMEVTMSDYKEANASDVSNPAPTGYTGSDRTFSWKYFETDKDGTVLDETKYTTTAPAVAGYYKVVVTAEKTDPVLNDDGLIESFGYPEETASADFMVTGVQDGIVFNPENKTAYFKAFGHTMLVEDLVTGIKGGATLHFQLDMGGSVIGLQKDQYVDEAVSSTKIKIYTDATDLYEAYESDWYSLPIVYCEWPEEACTIEGTKVEGVTLNGMDVYDGAVKVIPPEGYVIINDYDIRNHDGYDFPRGVFVRESDGAETAWGDYFEEGIWIDIDSPEIRPETLTLDGTESGEEIGATATFAAKEVKFDVDDNHYDVYDYSDDPEYFGDDPIEIISYPSLVSVTVDGEALALTDNALAHVKLTNNTPNAKTFTVVATDIANHKTTWKITLDPELETAPDPAYTLEGTQGKNNYFISEDITIKPADGYTISATPEDPDSFTDEIEYDEEIEEVWLYHTETGKYTEAVPFEEDVLIDTQAPEIGDAVDEEENEVTLSDGAELEVRSLHFTVEDDQILNSVTLNGTVLSIVDGVADVKLYASKEDTAYELIAEDKAGLTKKITFTIKASDVAASGKAVAVEGLVYDGSSQELVTAQDVENGTIMYSFTKDGEYSETVPTKEAAGTYTVWYKIVGDEEELNGDAHAAYADTEPASVKVTIAQKEISLVWSNTAFTYDKQSHCPTVVPGGVVDGDICNLTVEGGQVNAGTYEAEVTALSNTNYKLPENVTVSFTIAPRVVVLSWSDTEFTYDGEQHVAKAVVSNLLEGDTCSVTVSGAKTDAGTYTATATELSNGNYALPDEKTASFTIAGKTVGFVWANTSFVYDGEEHCPTVTVTGLVGNDTCTATVTGAAITAGTHTATVTALSNPNYILPEEVTTEFTIEKTGTVITKDPVAITGLIYNGTAQTLVEAGEVEGGKLQYCLTIGGEYKDEIPTATDAKKYTVYYKAVATDGNYQSDGSKIFSVEVTISQKTVSIEWENKAFIYNKEEQLPQAVATGLIEGDVCTTTVEGAQVNAGTYTATVTALSNANYKLPEDASATFTIQPVEATLQWERIEFYYDGKEHCITANVSNLLDGDSCTVTVTGGGINAGTYTATAVALSNPNYALPESVTEEFSINPKDVFITKEPAGKTLSYTGSEQELIVAGTATEGGKVVYRLQGAENFSDSIPVGKAIGEYRIQYTVESVDTNHSGGSQGGELTVVIAPKTLTLSWSDTEFTYDDKEHLPTATLNGVVEGEKVTVTVTGARKETGKYTATATFAGEDISNYKLPENTSVEFTIKQKEEPKKEKATGSASVTMGSFIFGGAATTPVITSSTHDTSKASISYKASGAPDDAYTGTKPTGVGTYTVRAILPENDNYKQYVATGTFTISYLPVPAGSYEITGKQGVGGWFTSEVQLTPAAGYEISIGDRSSFKTSSVTLTEEMAGRTFYIRSTNTGEQTAGITIAAMQIDTDAPTIEMEENNVYFCDEEGKLLGMANDKNLDKVYVNGVEVEVTDGDGVKTFDLPVDRKKQSVNVKVVDKAGNEKSMVVITAPAWMKSGVVGEGEFYLEPKNRYGTPSDGTCTLEGDASTYMPGVKFFTKKEGFHTFHVQH